MEKIKSVFLFNKGVKLIINYDSWTYIVKHPSTQCIYHKDTEYYLEMLDEMRSAIEFAKQELEDDSEQYEMPTTRTVHIDNTASTITPPTEQHYNIEFPVLTLGDTLKFTWSKDVYKITGMYYREEDKMCVCSSNTGMLTLSESELKTHWNAMNMTVNEQQDRVD